MADPRSTLPRDPAASLVADPVAATGASRRASVLVAEDDSRLSEMAARALSLAGYDVTTAPDGRAALQLIRSCSFDVLVTDLTMPHLNGDALARAARAERPRLPIVLMTATPEALRGSLPLATVLKKPFALDALVAAVAGARSRGRSTQSQATPQRDEES
jgi:DNA-binding response OmpR family regulator